MNQIWINGRMMRANASVLSPADRGFLLGDGVFETIRLADGRPHRWWAHMERLHAGLIALGIPPLIEEVLLEASQSVASANGLSEGVIRLTVSRGPGGRGLVPDPQADPTVLIEVNPLPARSDPPCLELVDFPRRNPMSLSALCKPIGYADMMLARNRAQQEGGDIAVMLSVNGEIACADCANLFWYADGVWKTPDLSTGAMAGVTRAAILKAAEEQSVPIIELAETKNGLSEAEAVCLTNSILGVVSAGRFGDRPLDQNHPGIQRLKDLEASAP